MVGSLGAPSLSGHCACSALWEAFQLRYGMAGMFHVGCHFKAYIPIEVMLLLFENLVSSNFDDDCEKHLSK